MNEEEFISAAEKEEILETNNIFLMKRGQRKANNQKETSAGTPGNLSR
jgi:hypothetical protein